MAFSSQGLAIAALTLLCGFTIGAGYTKKVRESLAFPVMFAIALLFYGAVSNREGWPEKVTELPDKFLFIHGIVRDPDPVKGVWGAIWVTVRTEDDPTRPRTFELPYSPGLASDVKKLEEAARIKAMEIPVETKKEPTQKASVKVTEI